MISPGWALLMLPTFTPTLLCSAVAAREGANPGNHQTDQGLHRVHSPAAAHIHRLSVGCRLQIRSGVTDVIPEAAGPVIVPEIVQVVL